MNPIPPLAPPTGPYQGAAGSEAQNPGRSRVPPPDWADPSSPNYERRNYYIHPVTGEAIAREPGYYNPENPYDTGRPHEVNEEFGAWNPALERRMSEPGVTPWGPGGRASAAGGFAAPGPGASAAFRGHPAGMDIARGLLGGPSQAEGIDFAHEAMGSPDEILRALLAQLGRRTQPRGHGFVE